MDARRTFGNVPRANQFGLAKQGKKTEWQRAWISIGPDKFFADGHHPHPSDFNC
jgi:hypothetical protein